MQNERRLEPREDIVELVAVHFDMNGADGRPIAHDAEIAEQMLDGVVGKQRHSVVGPDAAAVQERGDTAGRCMKLAIGDGAPVVGARDAALEKGVVINGLPIMVKEPSYSTMDIDNLDAYYEDCVIGGPGAALASSIRVFTTRPDTLFGATYMVLAPEHPLVDAVTTADRRVAVETYRTQAGRKSDPSMSLNFVQPQSSIASSSSRRRISRTRSAPCSPSTHNPHRTGRPTNTARAPSAIAFSTSLPRRIPPST